MADPVEKKLSISSTPIGSVGWPLQEYFDGLGRSMARRMEDNLKTYYTEYISKKHREWLDQVAGTSYSDEYDPTEGWT